MVVDWASLPPNWLSLAPPGTTEEEDTEHTVANGGAASSRTPRALEKSSSLATEMVVDLASLPPNWLSFALPGTTEEEEEDTEQTVAVPISVDSETPVAPQSPAAAAGSETPGAEEDQMAPPVPADSEAPVGPTEMAPRVYGGTEARMAPPVSAGSEAPVGPTQMATTVCSCSGNPVGVARMDPPVSTGSVAQVVAAQTAPSVPANPGNRAGPSRMPPPPRPPSPAGPSQVAPPPVFRRPESPVAPARTDSPPLKRPAHARPMTAPVSGNQEASARATQQMVHRPPKPPVYAKPTNPGVAAPVTPSVSKRPATPPEAARTMSLPPPKGPVFNNPTISGVAAQMTPPVSNRPATPPEAARTMPAPPPPPPRRPVTNPSTSTRPPTPAGTQTASRPPMHTRPMSAPPSTNPTTPAGPALMVSRPLPPRPVGTNLARLRAAQNLPSSMILLEADSSKMEPEVIRKIRESNRVALSVALDSRRDCTKINTHTGEEVWYASSYACHHVSGNLDLLSNLSPVSDCWVRLVAPQIQPFQALARGSVNRDGIILDDVWYVPDMMNIVSTSHLCAQGLRGDSATDAWIFKRFDDSVAGRGHVGQTNFVEMDFINTSTSEASWYLVSSAQEHMTGNLELLTDYRPIRPSRAVRTHTGSILQVCGKGSLKKPHIFSIPDISYVPGLNKNIISISQLTDGGHAIRFERNGCKIVRRDTPQVLVGQATYGGEELIRLCSLQMDRPLPVPGAYPNP